jgi:1-acyl-sn-glycerol-3-phosphate acyltransferase
VISRLLGRAIEAAFLALVRLFYPRTALIQKERLPEKGPVLVLANHPNGLIDPLLLRVGLGRRIAFLGKSTFWKRWLGRTAMEAFGALPIYRPKDGADTGQNEATFERCRALLKDGGWLAMFPEGTSHSDPEMKPLKTGAARIALSAEARLDFALGLRILPVGLLYEDKEIFRSRAALSIGAPFLIADWAERYRRDERSAVEALTGQIREALAEVVLEAESSELWRGFLAVASWTAPASDTPAADLGQAEQRARQLARAYKALARSDPERAEAVVHATQRFVRVLRAAGVPNPLSLEDALIPSAARLVGSAAVLALLSGPALLGALLGWVPYRAVRPIAIKLAKGENDVISTIKLLLGLLVMTTTYLAESVAVGCLLGPWAAALTFFVAPLSGFVALRFQERVDLRKEALRAFWLRSSRGRLADAVRDRRRELSEMIERALAEVREPAA